MDDFLSGPSTSLRASVAVGDEVMIQQAAERWFATNLVGRRRLVGNRVAQRDLVADALYYVKTHPQGNADGNWSRWRLRAWNLV